jgi:hypothetical protein
MPAQKNYAFYITKIRTGDLIFSMHFQNHSRDFAHFIIRKIDWRYFILCGLASAMYLFNVAASYLVHAHPGIASSVIASAVTNFPLLTLIYITALFELLDARILAGGLISRFRKVIPSLDV